MFLKNEPNPHAIIDRVFVNDVGDAIIDYCSFLTTCEKGPKDLSP